MDYRQLGNSGLRVSTLTLGTMGFGGVGWAAMVGSVGIDGVRRQLAMAIDAGVNLVDTADVYSEGLAEVLLGEALGSARDDLLIATKVRFEMGPGPNDAGLSRTRSLKGLAVEPAAGTVVRGHRDHGNIALSRSDSFTPLPK